MPHYKYVGPKVFRRVRAEIHNDYAVPGYVGFRTNYSHQTVEEVQPGDVLDDLTPAELTAFGDRFELLPDAEAESAAEPRHTRRTT